MEMVPDQRESRARHITNRRGQHNKTDRAERLKSLDNPDRPNEMQPKDKIRHGLRNASRDQYHPPKVHRAQNEAEHDSGVVRTHRC